MKKMRVLEILSPGKIEIREVEKPVPGYGQAVCKVIRAGICGTDYAIYTGEFSAVKSGRVKFPLQPGHEWAGIVDRIGPGVSNINIGDRVIGDTAISCGQCYECLTGEYLNCSKFQPVGTVNAWNGAMAEYVLFPSRHLFRLPNDVSFDNGALVEPAATGLYAVHCAPVSPGSSLAVLGAGTIGMAVISLARVYGAKRIIAIGRSVDKLDLCKKMGATDAINTKQDNLVDKIMSITNGKGVDVSIELSGSVDLFKACSVITKQGGVISIVAFYDKPIEFNIDEIVFHNHTYKPVPGGIGFFRKILDMLESGQIDLTPIITNRCSLNEAPNEIINMKKNNERKVKVMINISEESGESER